MDAVRPAVTDDAAELLVGAPSAAGRRRRCPIDLRLGDRFGYRALVVTGPNTGGKTVSLKTLGLLALMHQAGLRVPAADGARLPVFRRVMADIGDEQSIAQSLSTFSSHLRNVVRFVAAAGPGTLVLLDEVGAGTDPTEGSALAMAVVERLLDAGAMVAATTHYAELKAFATEHPGVTNASVEFDVAHAAADLSARRSGCRARARPSPSPSDSACRRRSWPMRARGISAEHATMEETLAAHRRGAGGAGRRAGGGQRRARGGRRRARAGARAASRERAREAGRDPGRCAPRRRRPRGPRRARGGRPAPRADAPAQPGRRPSWRERRRPLEDLDRRRPARTRDGAAADRHAEADVAELGRARSPRVGLWGRIRTLGSTGRIVEISGRTGRVTLETEDARLVVPADDVEVVPEPISGPAPRDLEAEELRRRAAERDLTALDLHGERVEAALERLSAYLDDALLAGLDERRRSSTGSAPARSAAPCATRWPSTRGSAASAAAARTRAATGPPSPSSRAARDRVGRGRRRRDRRRRRLDAGRRHDRRR